MSGIEFFDPFEDLSDAAFVARNRWFRPPTQEELDEDSDAEARWERLKRDHRRKVIVKSRRRRQPEDEIFINDALR